MRIITLLPLLGACFVVPYFLLEKGGVESIVDRWYGRDQANPVTEPYAAAGTSITANSSGVALTDTTAPFRTISSSSGPQLPVELAPIMSLEEVFDFKITPNWVLGRWPTVTTGLRRNDLVGYRVPLVTGTDKNDVTGSLTYYFGQTQQLQQILFEGDTGDGRRLVGWATSQMGMQQYASTDPGVYLYRQVDNETAVSELQLRPSRMMQTGDAAQRFGVSIKLTRPVPAKPKKSFFWSS